MDLILWRHAEAEPGEPDLGRRLTAKGIRQAERMAKWLDRHLPATTRVLSSPADRTQQTALALKRKFRVVPDLAPGASPAAVLAAAGWPDAREPVLIVGHQPTLGEVAAFCCRARRRRGACARAGSGGFRTAPAMAIPPSCSRLSSARISSDRAGSLALASPATRGLDAGTARRDAGREPRSRDDGVLNSMQQSGRRDAVR